ncbi:uncharacterized protein LOC117653152 [Thrips palmi]|uniref:Uncharacterized protein LOC117653152 n=1 Tax=Thrips palmi TaxID=161013 RepID=A0A6P9AAI1_THRPL|nr:uncharacterized protein LOC117653152 [Thrips palmi]
MAALHQNVVKEPGTRPGRFFFHVHDGFYYHLHASTKTRDFYKCVRSQRGCRARATSGADGFRHSITDHNHAADPWFSQEIALKNSILKACEEVRGRPFKEVIAELCEPFPEEVRNRVNIHVFKEAMQRAAASSVQLE